MPQGRVLGPVLFITFINDLPDTLSGLVKIFADDSKIYSSVENEQQQQVLQNDLDRLVTGLGNGSFLLMPQNVK